MVTYFCGYFYPVEKLEEAEMKLDGFVWHGEKWSTIECILEVLSKYEADKMS